MMMPLNIKSGLRVKHSIQQVLRKLLGAPKTQNLQCI